ncbi:uncharacterized protein LOC121405390 [Drosophila obscura]|uniref:uncharacterized protein LOC121405390 n=1 Tax=Drosophila obscura TaxID=7282 RepID=UPI001BB0DAEE|nr:uncharacterized protein LOC121405390 [Drosophila obscura]
MDNDLELGPNNMSVNNTPPQACESAYHLSQEEEAAFTKSSRLARSPISVAVQATAAETTQKEGSRSAFRELGEEIAILVGFIEDGKRRSIHQPMRDSIESIRALYELVAIQVHDNKAKELIRSHQSSQTSPIFSAPLEAKRRQGPGAPTPKQKRRKQHGNESPRNGPMARKEAEPTSTGSQVTPSASGGESWTIVARKGLQKAAKKAESLRPKENPARIERTRPDALLIQTKGEKTYAEILRTMKTDEKLKALGQAINRVRRTQKGELLLELTKSGEGTAEFKTIVAEALGESAEVRSLTQRVFIECKDLEEDTTAEDICKALADQLQLSDVTTADVRLRRAYGQTQIASIRLSAAGAQKALHAGAMPGVWAPSEELQVRNGSLKPLQAMWTARPLG